MKKKFDWASEARHAVRYTAGPMFPSHRGAMRWVRPGVTVVYGNDGLADNQRAKDGLADVRHYLAETGIKELGFATALDGYSWAMLIRSTDHDTPKEILWEAPTFRLRVIQDRAIRESNASSTGGPKSQPD
jgi:hypothetical protein